MDPMSEVTADRLRHWDPDGIICVFQSDGLKFTPQTVKVFLQRENYA